MKAWTIKQLKTEMLKDLAQCTDSFQRSMVEAICGKEIRESAQSWAKVRKLTPAEVAIAQEYGYRGEA